jgi:hypothetical protein
MEGSLSIADTLDQRSTCTFVVIDPTGTQHYQPGQPVLVTDSVNGLLFSGYIDNSQERNLYPQPHILSTIQCIDQHYLADKRVVQKNYANQYAGDIAADLLHTYLAAEGVNLSNLASRSDHYQADWGQGTLSGVVAASNVNDGNLELAPSGSSAAYAQQTSSDFSGPSTLMGYNNALGGVTFIPTQSMKLSGTQGIAGVSNAFVYVKFWSGSFVIPSGAVLTYDIWIPDSCPQQMAGIDLVFTDGTTLRDFPVYPASGGLIPDQQGVGAHPGNDLSGLATNQWYHRVLPLYGTGTLVGKTLAYATFAFEGDNTGNYTAYVRNVTVGNSPSIQTLFAGSLLTGAPQQLQTSGYSNVQLQVVTTYEVSGSMESTTFDTTSAGIYNTSLLQWQETDATNCTVAVNFSADNGATFQPCTNNAPLPALLPGQSLSGIKTLFQYIFTNTGNDPTQTPILSSVQAVINPSYACTKSDIVSTYNSSGSWGTGTLNNLQISGSALAQQGVTRNWSSANLANQTMFGGNGPGQYVSRGTMEIRLNNGSPNWGISRFDFAGQWQNFTAEIDVNVTTAGDEYGLVYRTTGWQNVNDTYAYSVYVNTQQIALAYGTNTSSGSGLFTLISSVNITLATGNWHRLKVVVNGTNHKVYLDNTLYINVTDSTYTAAGYIGARGYSSTANYDIIQFNNFGVCSSLSGQWVSPAINLSALGNLTNSQITALIDPTVNLSLCSLLIEISTNNGSTWTACPQTQAATSNLVLVSAVPGLAAGTNVGSITQAKIRLTLSSSTASSQIDLLGFTLTAIGQYSSSGSRISPSSSLSGIGTLGSSSISWNGLVPANTSAYVDSSTDGVNWTQVGTIVDSTPGNAQIAGLTGQPDPTQDQFITNTSSNYTQTYQTGGAVASYNWDTANTRLIATGGTNALLLCQGITAANVMMLTVMDYADAGGFCWCFADASDFYYLVVADGSATSNANTIILYKVSGNVTSQLASSGISFARNTPHTVQMTMNNGVMTVLFDNVQKISYTDAHPLASGQCGLYTNGGTEQFYQLLINSIGQTITNYTPPVDINKVQSTMIASTGAVTSQVVTLGNGVGSGNLLIATISTGNNATSVTPPAGWSQAVFDQPGGSANCETGIWWAIVGSGGVSAGTNSFTFTFSAAHNIYIDLSEWNSNTGWQASPIDQTAKGNTAGTSGTTLTSGTTATTSQAVEVLIASITYDGTPQTETGLTTGWLRDNEVTDGTNHTAAMFYNITSSTGAGQCSFSIGTAQYWDGVIATFKPNAASSMPPVAYTRVRLTTTDPTVTPQITDLSLAAHSPQIGKGILITKANYSVLPTATTTSTRNTTRAGNGYLVSAALDDLAKQSNYTWRIDKNKNFVFAARAKTQAPRVVQSSEMLLATVRVTNITNQYRNSQWITSAINTISQTDSFYGDGKKRSFTLKYPVYAISSITVDGATQLVGVKGTDTGKQWYYSQGSNTISQDISLFPLLKYQTLTVTYQGQYQISVNEQSSAAISARAALDGTSGIVEAVENAPELIASAAQNLANARLGEYAVQGKQIQFTTNVPGLAVGQQATVFIPQHAINGMQFLITNMTTTYKTVMQNGIATLLPYYSIKAVYGAMLYDWTHYFMTMGN